MPILVEKGKEVVQQVKHWTRGPLLYHGTSGAIFEGIDHDSLDKLKIIIKCVPLHDTKALRLITNERKILEKLSNCPNVVRFLGASISDHVKEFGDKKSMNIFLEHIPKGNLHQLLQSCEGQKLSEPVTKRFTRDIVQALSYMHGIGIVHGNINGSNVLLDDQCIKLCDFGLSWDVKSQIPIWMEHCHMHVDTQQKTPELLLKWPGISLAMDVFALGSLVCEMLMGRRARVHDSYAIGVEEKKVKRSKSPSNIIVEIPKNGWEDKPHAHDFVTKCLIKEPRKRWKVDQLLKHPWIESVDDLTVIVEMNSLHTLSFW